jgi:hypothetical protein
MHFKLKYLHQDHVISLLFFKTFTHALQQGSLKIIGFINYVCFGNSRYIYSYFYIESFL